MGFHQYFFLDKKNSQIKKYKGLYRDREYFETIYNNNDPILIEKVFTMLEQAYHIGENNGRNCVRNNIKNILGIDY